MAICLIVTVWVQIPGMIEGPNKGLIAVADKLDSEVKTDENLSRKDLKIYVDYNQGGFFEYRGYRPYIDPRMEVFIKSNNGKEDIFKEYYDMECGRIKIADFVKKYDFDYMVVMEYEDFLYDLEDKNYELIYETNWDDLTDEEKTVEVDDENVKSGIRLYKKNEM